MSIWLYLFFIAFLFNSSVAEETIKNDLDKNQQAAPPAFDKEPSLESTTRKTKLDISFYHGFFASLSVIIVSELGDKTWFIAIIMSMKHSRLTVFSGAIAALALMTVLSACLGWITQLIPRAITYYISTLLFALFGLKMLHEGYHMRASNGTEGYDEAQEEVAKRELDMDSSKFSDMESGSSKNNTSSPWVIFSFVSRIFLEAFTLTFLAEWGDRSQLTTIILAARENIPGVIIGGILGHAICTGIAVLGGKLVAQRISIRTVTLIGGVVFLIFALSALFIQDDEPAPLDISTL
ncbi:unnamed protein product, partial [Mesorhabditis belari]|uniref:GDT1 family protein n=1 Tax=Mesorhabditis belari TaxID=2138241 RepID=A0AAF3E7X7_9BILA